MSGVPSSVQGHVDECFMVQSNDCCISIAVTRLQWALFVGSHTRCLSCVRQWILCQLVVCTRGRSKWGAGRTGEKDGRKSGMGSN